MTSEEAAAVQHFFDERRVGDNEAYTHTLAEKPWGKACVTDEDYSTWLELIGDAAKAGTQMSITEKQHNIGPLVFDLDFETIDGKRYYTPITIKNVITIIISAIFEILQIGIQYNKLICYVTEKESPTKKKQTYKDGFHLVFPYVICAAKYRYAIRNVAIKSLSEKKTFRKIPLLNKIDNVVDESVVVRNGWMMYGSTRSTTLPYHLTHVYSFNGDKLVEKEDHPSIKRLVKILALRKPGMEDDEIPVNDNYVEEEETDTPKKKVKKVAGENQVFLSEEKDDVYVHKATQDKFEEAKALVSLLSEDRANPYYEWFQVGLCLHNIGHQLLDTWITFSKHSSKFKEGECQKLWKKMKENNYTISTLYFWAREDSPRELEKFIEVQGKDALYNALSKTDHDVAQAAHHFYRHEFVCTNLEKQTYYYFNGTRWILDKKGHTLRLTLSNDFAEKFRKYSRKLDLQADHKSGPEKDYIVGLADRARDLGRNKLKQKSSKNNIMAECNDLFYREGFDERLNQNRYLTGYLNGIYDWKLRRLRQGCPDDMISFTTGINYVPINEAREDPNYEKVMDFLKSIMPDKKMFKYLLGIMSLCLTGDVSREEFYIVTGSGSNGKSKLFNLASLTLGDYYKPLDVRALTQKRANSSTASPEFYDKLGVRLAEIDEPEANAQLMSGISKLIAGGTDKIPTRGLYEGAIVYMEVLFKPFLLCNKMPDLSNVDGGMERRIRVISFPMKFVRKPTPGTNERPINEKLSEEMKEWPEVFASILTEIYHMVEDKGLATPPQVLQDSKDYIAKNDRIMEYMLDVYEVDDDSDSKIPVKEIARQMRAWYKEVYDDNKCPNKKEIEDAIKQRYSGQITGQYLCGFREKEVEEHKDASSKMANVLAK
jgi:phage/plasmid-associated DNA primase